MISRLKIFYQMVGESIHFGVTVYVFLNLLCADQILAVKFVAWFYRMIYDRSAAILYHFIFS